MTADSGLALGIAAGIIAVVTLVALIVWFLIVARRRQIVERTSHGLLGLEELNGRFSALVRALPSITGAFENSVKSKAKFDRYDLLRFMSDCVLEHEGWYQQEIAARVQAIRYFDQYHREFGELATRLLGTSKDDRVRLKHYKTIEAKYFHQRKLTYPVATASITSTVRYQSPKGQNAYARVLTWDFDQLTRGLFTAQEDRARQSTIAARRQRERSLMTPSLRMAILRRDGHRCRMCGASPDDGAVLHVDHITPVSRGGLTTPDNLQTLCDTCNFGKSDNFVG